MRVKNLVLMMLTKIMAEEGAEKHVLEEAADC